MDFFGKKKQYEVKPGMTGFLFRNHRLAEKLEPGFYEVKDERNQTTLICLPRSLRLVNMTGQEVLTKDNISLRFSCLYFYQITDGEKFLSNFVLDKDSYQLMAEMEMVIYNVVQTAFREKIATMDSETINENRHELVKLDPLIVQQPLENYGITLKEVALKDLSFPKSIQDLFAKHLEAKIRSKAELENARTTVATARALKNASELMKGDDNIRFMQLLETVTKIAEKGKHTFNFGDMLQLGQKPAAGNP